MKLDQNKALTSALSIILFSVAIMLSFNVFARQPFFSGQLFEIGGIGPGGGIIFHVTDDGQHGLEAAQVDQHTNIVWSFPDDVDKRTQAGKSGINGGSFNTDRIISTHGAGLGVTYAALLASDYNGGGYGDWYLPSIDELNLMYTNLHLQGVGGFASAFYWSSTEPSTSFAWILDFGTGDIGMSHKSLQRRIRAVRAF